MADIGLEGFVDRVGIIANELVEEEEISRLAAGFATWVHKQVACLEGEFAPISDGKRPKRSSPNEEDQKDSIIIPVDSLDQASNDQSILEGAPSEAGAPIEEGILTGGPSNIDEI